MVPKLEEGWCLCSARVCLAVGVVMVEGTSQLKQVLEIEGLWMGRAEGWEAGLLLRQEASVEE